MKCKMHAICLSASLLAGLGASQTLLAQDDDVDGEGAMLEEIIVTATKREMSIYDVPMAITAFTAESMEIAGITGPGGYRQVRAKP